MQTSVEIGDGALVIRDTRRVPDEVHVELRRSRAGIVSFAAASDHLLRVHAGGPVQGICSSSAFLYRHGDLDLFPAGASDTWSERSESMFLVAQVSPRLLERAAEESGGKPESTRVPPRFHFRDEQMEHIAWALEAEQRAGNPTGRTYTDALGLALAARLLGAPYAPTKLASGMTQRQMRRVIEYIEEEIGGELSLEELAAVAGVSATTLKTSFRRHAGVPVHRFVLERRVERAKSILLRGEIPISQVALTTGFAHPSHMARWMRRLLGQTPSQLVRSANSD